MDLSQSEMGNMLEDQNDSPEVRTVSLSGSRYVLLKEHKDQIARREKRDIVPDISIKLVTTLLQ